MGHAVHQEEGSGVGRGKRNGGGVHGRASQTAIDEDDKKRSAHRDGRGRRGGELDALRDEALRGPVHGPDVVRGHVEEGRERVLDLVQRGDGRGGGVGLEPGKEKRWQERDVFGRENTEAGGLFVISRPRE